MIISFYNCTAPHNVVDKTDGLEFVIGYEGTLKEESSITNLVVTIEYNDVPTFNYAHIPEFLRYYYIDNIVSIRTGVWELHMSVDVLNTYKTGIFNLNAFIERSNSYYNPMLIDKRIIFEQGLIREDTVIDNNVFSLYETLVDEDTFCYAVTGLGLRSKGVE